MSKKNGFSMLETIIPMVRLFPPARLRAGGLGWYFNSSIALITRARVDVLTTLALLSTRETVAVETLARRATCSRFMSLTLYKMLRNFTFPRSTKQEMTAFTRFFRCSVWLALPGCRAEERRVG